MELSGGNCPVSEKSFDGGDAVKDKPAATDRARIHFESDDASRIQPCLYRPAFRDGRNVGGQNGRNDFVQTGEPGSWFVRCRSV